MRTEVTAAANTPQSIPCWTMDDGPPYPFYLDDELMSLLGVLPSPAANRGSAFTAYQQRRTGSGATSLGWSSTAQQYSSGSGVVNVHRSMHRYLRSIDAASASTGTAPTWEAPQVGRGSQFRHIMRERLRRERLSQGYADLQARLPHGRASKGAKNNVVGAAVDYIRELEGRKGWLSARSEELHLTTATAAAAVALARSGGARGGEMVVKVRAESGCHGSMVDVFEVVLRRLKAMEADLRVTAIQSCFRAGVLCMDVGVESKVSSCEVDMAVTNAMMEHQKFKPGSGSLQDPTGSRWSFRCQTVSGVLMR